MNCPKCHAYVSGDWCKLCETIIFEKPQKSKAIKKRSDRGKAEDLVYRSKRLKFLRLNPRCAVYNELKSIEIHHGAGRIGKNYLDESTWFAVSRRGHQWIHENDADARELGFLLTRTN